MKVVVRKASDWNYREEKEFKSLRQLFNFMRKTYNRWIIAFEPKPMEIMIYDDYVE